MKHLAGILVFCLGSAAAQDGGITAARAGLNGPVRTVVFTERKFGRGLPAEGSVAFKSSVTYDRRGFCIEEVVFKPEDGSIDERFIYERDGERVNRTISTAADPAKEVTILRKYDEHEREIEKTTVGHEGVRERMVTTYPPDGGQDERTYDANGKQVRRFVWLPGDNAGPSTGRRYEGEKLISNSVGVEDPKTGIFTHIDSGEDGETTIKSGVQPDGTWREDSKTIKSDGTVEVHWSVSDQRGHPIERGWERAGESGRTHYDEFDDKGRLTAATDFNREGNPVARRITAYVYDAYGNWTQQTVSRREPPTAPPAIELVYTQEITYY